MNRYNQIIFSLQQPSVVPHTYRHAKMQALEFSVLTEAEAIIAHNCVGVCAVCGKLLTADNGPQAHHGIISKGNGAAIDQWWNLFIVCDETCHGCLEAHTEWERVVRRHYIHISAYHLYDDEPTEKRGYDWLREQIDRLGLVCEVELPLPREEVMATK